VETSFSHGKIARHCQLFSLAIATHPTRNTSIQDVVSGEASREVSCLLRRSAKSDNIAASHQHLQSRLESANLNELPQSHPLRRYIASDEGHIGRIAAMDMKVDDNMTVDDLDRFMQKMTEKNIVNDAKNLIKDGSGEMHQSKK
jgi:hypothetical protein